MKGKIIHVITRLDTGGSAENVIYSCDYFANGRFPVKDKWGIVLVYGGEDKNIEKTYGIYYLNTLKREISLFNDLITLIRLFVIYIIESPDIIHTHSSKAGTLGRISAFIYKIFKPSLKIIHTPHGHIYYGYFSKLKTKLFIFIEKLLAYITDTLIALTDNEMYESIKFGVGSSEKWKVVHSGIKYDIKITDKNLKEKLGLTGSIIVGSVGRLEPIKGMEYFVRAIPLIVQHANASVEVKDVKFLIVGGGSQEKFLKKLAKELGIDKYVIFTGMRENVYDFINIMDIYVQPSLNEGQGKTVLMAQLMEKPVVASSVCGLKSTVIDNKTGFLVKPKNCGEIADRVFKLIEDKKLRVFMSENGVKWVNKEIDGFPQFSVERMIYLLEKLYNDLL